jgi:hypothetical protein
MKQVLLTFFILLGTAWTVQVSAIHNTTPPLNMEPMTMGQTMTVNDFLAFDYKGYRTAEGKKMKWTHRLAMGMTQKKLAKQVRKGNLEGTAPLSTAMAAQGRNTHGLLSVIFAFAGLVVPYLGFGLIIAGFVLGIIGIKKDANPTLAIIGTVISGVFLLLLLMVIVLVASGGWFWF